MQSHDGRLRGVLTAILLSLLVVGCAGPVDIRNQPLGAGQANAMPGLPNWAPNRPFIIMSLSGGGSRAAALAYYTLERLKRTPDGRPGKNLLDDVAVISSVSGGSVTAAYFGLYGSSELDDFMKDFLDPSNHNMRILKSNAANPITVFRLVFGSYTPVDAEIKLFNDKLYHGATLSQLFRKKYPYIILNATDMASGHVFAFTPQRFNDICSNIRNVPISVAVAASAAFPVLLSPVTLQDYSYPQCPGDPPAEQWITDELHKSDVSVNRVAFNDAEYANALRHGFGAYPDIRYVHLLDGGLADNLGVHSLMEVVASQNGDPSVLKAIDSGKLRRVVVITVRARERQPNAINLKANTPGIISMINSSINVPLDAGTASLAAAKDDLINDMEAAAAHAGCSARFGGTQIYNIDIDPGDLAISAPMLAHAAEKIPTTWSISKRQLQTLKKADRRLFDMSNGFRQLREHLGKGEPKSFHADCRERRPTA